jgi:hypothetical protein
MRAAHGIFELQERVSTDEQKVQVYKFNTSGAEHLGTASDSVFVTNYDQLLDDGYKVVAVVADSKLDLTPNTFRDYEFNPFVVEEINFGYLNFTLRVKSTIRVTKPDTTYTQETTTFLTNSTYYTNNTGPMPFSRNGNTVSYAFGYTDQYGANWTLNATLAFDDLSIGIPRKIESFSIELEASHENTEWRQLAEGQNVEFRSEYSFHEFGGSITPGQISDLTESYTSSFRTEELIGFDTSEGTIRISF